MAPKRFCVRVEIQAKPKDRKTTLGRWRGFGRWDALERQEQPSVGRRRFG